MVFLPGIHIDVFKFKSTRAPIKDQRIKKEQQCGNHGWLFCIFFGFFPIPLEDNLNAFLCVELSGNAKNCLHLTMRYIVVILYVNISKSK